MNRSARSVAWAMAAALLLALPLVACWGPEWESVHFHSDRPDFFRMPRPWRASSWPHRALKVQPSRWDQEDPPAPSTRLVKQARRQEQAGQFRAAAASWVAHQRLLRTDHDDPYTDPTAPDDPQIDGLDDRIAALRTWRGPADTAALTRYLRVRDLVNARKLAQAKPLLAVAPSGPLAAHYQYLRAALRFHGNATPEQSATAFAAVAKRHPGFAAAHYMVGRSLLGPRIVVPGQVNSIPEARLIPLKSPADQAALRRAAAAYEACVRVEPRGPLASSARGMIGACRFRLGDYVGALLEYCRILAALPPGESDLGAWISGRACLRRMTLANHQAFQKHALAEPEVATVYLDLHLHYGRAGARTHQALGLYALEVLRRHPQAPISGRMLSRLAVIEERLGHAERAERLAARAIVRSEPGSQRDMARWAHARAMRRLGRDRESLAEYERLAAGASAPNLRRGAREAAAILCERLGDLPRALLHYFALQYQLDYAYVIDALATPDDLRAFLRRYPNHPRAKLVRYSLGFRLLRAGKYPLAEQTFASLGPKWLLMAEKKYACDTSKGKPRTAPLETARYLLRSQREEAAAKTPAAKADIAYARGQFLFRQRHLLFYNGALWAGRRTWAFELQGGPFDIQTSSPSLSAGEQRAYDRYQHEHAALYQALQAFDHVARAYPKTPQAPKALYSAALCCTFLPSLEFYWNEKDQPDFEARAISYYRRLVRDYPDDPLAPAAVRFGGVAPTRNSHAAGAKR